jgi:aminoglycoside phosphotransferase family enzyme/predicted kinase
MRQGEQALPAGQFDQRAIDGLLRPAAYPHAADDIVLVETHISWVFLAGDYAYKIKKPVALGFLDFRDLESRRFYCGEEIRLNKPWAPEIYIGVVKITLRDGQPEIEGAGAAGEYAVKMRRFDQALRLDRQLQDGLLSAMDMRELATNIAERHQTAEFVPANLRRRALDLTESLMWDNFTALRPHLDRQRLQPLYEWTLREVDRLRAVFVERFERGFYRDCHGDLHLANLVRLPDGISTFDCIEFSADLRNIDVACDIAFLVMDIASKGRNTLAAYFINRYLERTDDYDSMRVFNAYFVYRCLVRAKVAAIRSLERQSDEAEAEDIFEAERYCDMAASQIASKRPQLIMMHGLSGSGKTWLSDQLMAALPAIRIRSDLVRKRLFGLAETARTLSAVADGIYSTAADSAVYAAMHLRASAVLRTGHDVILDATYLQLKQRDTARSLADENAASFSIVRATAPVEELQRRIRARQQLGSDASEAGLAVLQHQLANIDTLTDTELAAAISVDSRDAETALELPLHIRRAASN